MAKHEQHGISVALRIVLRYWRIFLLSAALAAIIGLLVAPMVPVQYTGTAKFMRRVDPASEHLTGARSESFASRKLTLRNDIAGRRAVERVVEELGMTRGLPRSEDGLLTEEGERARRRIVESVQDKIGVEWEVQSDQVDLIVITYSSPDPELAQKIPNAVVHNYISWVSAKIVDNLRDSKEFLEKQVERCRRQLDVANAELLKFESENAGMMPSSPHVLQEQIMRITADLDVLRRQKTLAKKQLEQLKQLRTASEEPSTQPVQWVKGRNPKLALLEQRLREAEEVLETMLKVRGMKPAHPEVQAQQRELERIQALIDETEEEVITQKVFSKQGESVDLEMELSKIQVSLEVADNEIERLESRLQRLTDLQANFGPVRQKYDKMVEVINDHRAELMEWQKRYTDVEMALAAESAKRRTHHDTVSAAQPQHLPSSPSLIVILGGVLAVAGGAGAGVVFLLHKTDQSIRTVDEAEAHFDVPVHGAIGRIPTPAGKMRTLLARLLVWPAVWAVVLACLLVVALNVVLWLRFPDKHKRWKQAPVSFLQEVAAGQWDKPVAPSGGP